MPSHQQIYSIKKNVFHAGMDKNPIFSCSSFEIRRHKKHLEIMSPLKKNDPNVIYKWKKSENLVISGICKSASIGLILDLSFLILISFIFDCDNKNGKNAEAVAAETTYESGEGDAVIIPVPVQQTQQVAIKNKRGRTVGYRTVVIDDTELAMYGGK